MRLGFWFRGLGNKIDGRHATYRVTGGAGEWELGSVFADL